jgi:hypothetical protein
VNPARTYVNYLHRKAAEDPSNIFIRGRAYLLPWLLLMFAFLPIDAVFDLSRAARIWVVGFCWILGGLGMALVAIIFIRENAAAARRQTSRYSDSRYVD